MSEKRFCTNCGNELAKDVRFCGKCGAPVAQEAVETQTERTDAERQTERVKTEPRYTGAETKSYSDEGNPVTNHETARSKNVSNQKKWIPVLIVILIAAIAALLIGMKLINSNGSSAANSQGNVAVDVSSDEENAEENTEERATADTESEEAETESEGKVKGYDSPEEYIISVFNKYFVGSIDAEGYWEDCVSDLSKELGMYDKDTYVDNLVNLENQSGLTYISYEATGTEELDDGIYQVNGTLKYSTASDGQQTEQSVMYVIVENNTYKTLIDGAISVTYYTAADGDGELTTDNVRIYQCVNDTIILACNITNNSSTEISFGWSSGSQIELVLADGTSRYYTYSYPDSIYAGDTVTMSVSFENVDSDMSQLIFHSVYILQSNGLPSNMNGSDYTVSFPVEG